MINHVPIIFRKIDDDDTDDELKRSRMVSSFL